jgi:hypothetical protein
MHTARKGTASKYIRFAKWFYRIIISYTMGHFYASFNVGLEPHAQHADVYGCTAHTKNRRGW